MFLTEKNGVYHLITESYGLIIPTDRPYVYLETVTGQRLAELFILSGVHPQGAKEDNLGFGGWEVAISAGKTEFTLQVESSHWKAKTIRLGCLAHRLTYSIEIEGTGLLEQVDYFGGYSSAQLRWGTGFFWSGQQFSRVFTPEPNSDEINTFDAKQGSVIDLSGVPLPGRGDWFFTPPPFCYAFESRQGWVGVGVEAGAGEHGFTEYAYRTRGSGFHLALAYDAHTQVHGRCRLPVIGFDFGADAFDVLAAHVAGVRERLAMAPPIHPTPPWWSEPIFCGWGSQCHAAKIESGLAAAYSRQALYETWLARLAENEVCPGTVVLDDKWQQTYGNNEVDEAKWPDLPGFIGEQHARGRKVLLWLKAWDPEGVPVTECITNAAGRAVSVDPTNPAFEQRLRKSVRRMLAADGYNADGFKIDFTARIPSGPGLQAYGGAWGLELMKRYLGILYNEAKLVKTDALVMTHTPHPYLADVLDMVRLNDINAGCDVNQAMSLRARIAALACPSALIDTDNWPLPNKAAWQSYLELQTDLGVPSLYYTGHIDATQEPLEAEDYARVRAAWQRYRADRAVRNGYALESAG